MSDEPDAPPDSEPVEGSSTQPADEPVTTERRTISGRVQVIWGVRVAGFVFVLTIGLFWLSGAVDAVPMATAPAVGLTLLVIGLLWVHGRYRVWAYEVRDDSLYLERGVVTHVRTIAPFVRIQHVDTQRGPMERWLGLSTLVVYTAGSRGADVSIPGLLPHEARDLQARVKELAIEAEGGDAV